MRLWVFERKSSQSRWYLLCRRLVTLINRSDQSECLELHTFVGLHGADIEINSHRVGRISPNGRLYRITDAWQVPSFLPSTGYPSSRQKIRTAGMDHCLSGLGTPQARQSAVSLGTFHSDNAAKKRWVLKAGNPKALADIDAVFGTVEPPGGSCHPSGKPLLFAYLRIEANHP